MTRTRRLLTLAAVVLPATVVACNLFVGIGDLPYPSDAGGTTGGSSTIGTNVSNPDGGSPSPVADAAHDAGPDVVCLHATTRCEGSGVETCGANGQWGNPVACDGGYCNGGVCGECAANTQLCAEGGLMTCTALGEWSTPAACAAGTPDCVGTQCICEGTMCNGGACVPDPSDCVCDYPSYDAAPCTAPIVDGAIPLDICAQSTVGSGGGVYTFGDGVSTVCVDSTAFCGEGVTAPSETLPDGASIFGGAIGIVVDNNSAATAPTLADAGMTFSLSAVPAYGVDVSLNDENGVNYFYELPASSSANVRYTVPWATFNTLGYDVPPNGSAFVTTDPIRSISFIANSGPAATNWSFCVTYLGL